MQRKKIGLVLGAGGARGFCHIGVLQVLEENKVPIDIITGCSMGSLVGGAYAAGVTADAMEEIAGSFKQFSIMDFDISIIGKTGFIRGENVTKLIKKIVGEEKQVEDTDIKYAAVATDLISNQKVVLDKGPLWQAIRSSIAIPAAFKPVDVDGMLLIDGCILCRLPIDEARAMGADIIIAVDAIGPPRAGVKPTGLIHLIDRTFNIANWEYTKTAIENCDLVINPEMGERSQFVFKDNEVAIKAGRDATIAAMPHINELLKSL